MFNVVHGDKVAVDAILAHPGIAAVSFVGSTPIARYVYEAGTRAGKRVQALGGAKNHMVVLPDADLDLAADAAVSAAYGSTGQRCMAVSVVVAVGDAADVLLPRLRERLATAEGRARATRPAPRWVRSSRASTVRVLSSYVERGEAEGAELVVDGRSVEVPGHEDGFFLGPCLFDRVTPDMAIYTDEIFGPVLGIVRAETLRRGAGARERESLRQRGGHVHERRRRRTAVPERGAGRHGRHQRADPRADGVLLVRRLEAARSSATRTSTAAKACTSTPAGRS